MIGDGGFGDVNVQDQTTPPIDSYFLQSVNTFTLSADTPQSTISTLEYFFDVDGGHTIIVGSEILLLDVLTNKSFYAVVIGVIVNNIQVDRPIDHAFPFAGAVPALCRTVISNMNVNGSVTAQIFSLRAGSIPVDATRFIIRMFGSSAMDDGKFGNLTKLTRGLVFRIVDSYQKTVFNFKDNGEIANFCFDDKYADKAPAGTGTGYRARITFAGQSKHGVVFRIKNDDVLQWIVQDDLTGLTSLKIVVEGHETDVEF